MALRVLTWNVFHGRAIPPRDADLLAAFAARLATWEWDVALLQEVPPWWPDVLAAACDAEQRHALTSRNGLLPLRRGVARRRPELLKSNGGGANAILVRGLGIAAHERRRLRTWPERRVVHAVRDDAGRWYANLHASVHDDARAHADVAKARAAVLRWSGGAPAVLGGDLNVRDAYVSGFLHVGGDGVDHVFARGLEPAERCEVLDRGTLSDHAPVRVTLAL
jgi:endonuclease/exonuclease/phosphatase family metal-dependent hydrolase